MVKKIKNKKESIKKQNSNRFDFDDEIIIGVTKYDDENESKSKVKKTNKKIKKNDNKKKKDKDKTKVKVKEKRIKKQVEEEIVLDEEEQERRKHNFKIIKYMSILVLLVITVVVIMFSPLFDVKKITVSGNSKVPENEIISLSGIKIDSNTFKINKLSSVKSIKENAYIEDVEIKRELPSGIQIIVEERKPSFQIEFGSDFVYINNQGYILEITSEKLEVPVLQGQVTEDANLICGKRLDKKDLKKLSKVLEIMELAVANELDGLITRVDITNDQNYKLALESEGKIVYLGDCTNLSTRMLNVKAIVEREKGIEGEIFVDMDLNVSYPTFRQKV